MKNLTTQSHSTTSSHDVSDGSSDVSLLRVGERLPKNKFILFTGLFFFGILVLMSWRMLRSSSDLKQMQEASRSALNETLIAPALIDSLSDIIKIPTLQSGVIKTLQVTAGEKVKKGQVLFSLDDSVAENMLHICKIKLKQARRNLEIQKQAWAHAKYQSARLKEVDKRAISQSDLLEKMHEVMMLHAKVKQAEQELELALANLDNAELTLNQFTIKAPREGIVLQINAHVNEFVGSAQPVILLGDAKKVMVRISLDERDSLKFNPDAVVTLISDDNSELKIPLIFVQQDKYIITQERLNSRVQEILYYFNREKYPYLAAGRQMDVTISPRTSA